MFKRGRELGGADGSDNEEDGKRRKTGKGGEYTEKTFKRQEKEAKQAGQGEVPPGSSGESGGHGGSTSERPTGRSLYDEMLAAQHSLPPSEIRQFMNMEESTQGQEGESSKRRKVTSGGAKTRAFRAASSSPEDEGEKPPNEPSEGSGRRVRRSLEDPEEEEGFTRPRLGEPGSFLGKRKRLPRAESPLEEDQGGSKDPKKVDPIVERLMQRDLTQDQKNLSDERAIAESLPRIEEEIMHLMRIFASRENMQNMRIPENFYDAAVTTRAAYQMWKANQRRGKLSLVRLGAGLSNFQLSVLPVADFILSKIEKKNMNYNVLKRFVNRIKSLENRDNRRSRLMEYSTTLDKCETKINSYINSIMQIKERAADMRVLSNLLENFKTDKDDLMNMAALIESNFLERYRLPQETQTWAEISTTLANRYDAVIGSHYLCSFGNLQKLLNSYLRFNET